MLMFSPSMNCRQPPRLVMSRAPLVAWVSQRKPFTCCPSSSVTVPMPSGAGMPSTKLPNAPAGTSQTSTSIARPGVGAHHPRPRRRELGKRVKPVLRRRAAFAREARAALDELAVERQPRHVGAAHGDANQIVDLRNPARVGTRKRQARRPHRLHHGSLRDLAQRAERLVGERRRGERDAERQSVALEARRHRDRREVEQVHEVGVVAEVAVELHRVGLDLGDAVDGARGRRHAGGRCLSTPPRSRGAAPAGGSTRRRRRSRVARGAADDGCASPDAAPRARARRTRGSRRSARRPTAPRRAGARSRGTARSRCAAPRRPALRAFR